MKQPDPSAATVALWLKTISRGQLHDRGWIAINKRFHGMVRAARPFLQANFPDDQHQEAAFDGFTLALLAVAHFEDIARLEDLFAYSGASEVLADSTQQMQGQLQNGSGAIELPNPVPKDE